jgi:tRNA(Ile)-lysidine synthase
MGFQLTHALPERCLVAVSGGVDSITALHWLSQVPNRVRGIVHINHASGTFADEAEKLVRRTSQGMGLESLFFRITHDPPEGDSVEEFWRKQRYQFFKEASDVLGGLPIVLAHTLDDCLEEYIICTMVRGFSGTIPYQHGDCIRPFRLWRRTDIVDYANRHGLFWLDDPSNRDYVRFLRAKVRQTVVPRIRYLNPGVYNIVEKVIREQDIRNQSGHQDTPVA